MVLLLPRVLKLSSRLLGFRHCFFVAKIASSFNGAMGERDVRGRVTRFGDSLLWAIFVKLQK
jgi:hypothetical protein